MLHVSLVHFIRIICLALVCTTASLWRATPLTAQSCTRDSEPNDQPGQATPISGDGCIAAELGDSDQDLYAWTVPEADARQLWTFTIQGAPTGVTGFQILRVTLANNGVDVAESTKLYEVSALRGGPVTVGPLLFVPGTYYLGVVGAGATGAYQVTISAGESLPAATKPTSTQDAPAPLPAPQDDKITLVGDLRDSDDHFRWTLTDTDASQRWRIAAQFPVGEKGTIDLYDSQNNQITYRDVSAQGWIDLSRLGLAAGDYRIQLTPPSDYTNIYRLILQPDGERTPNQEEEPNDDLQHAWFFDPTTPLNGAFPADHYDLDFYKVTVDETFAASQWQLVATPTALADYEICLLDSQGTQVQCRTGDGGEILPTLTDLVLTPGDYYITIRNKLSTATAYTLAFEEIGELAGQQESEPNDLLLYATPLGETTAIQGRFAGYEDDYYQLTVTGAPQLWRVQVTGDGLEQLSLAEVDGAEPASVRASGDTRLRLDDLYLLPGDHFVRLRGTDGDYTLRAIPLGPPAESVTMPPLVTDGQTDAAEGNTDEETVPVGVTEREPNNNDERAERLRFDTPRSGRLSNGEDSDLYRFSLAGPEQVRLTVVQPPDGLVTVNLTERFSNGSRDAGTRFIYETQLGPGDYTIRLSPNQPSDDLYYLLLERLNPLDLPTDQEPNNNEPQTAPLLPASLTVTGTVNYAEDSRDWYQLPLLPTAADAITAVITVSPAFPLEVRAGDLGLTPSSSDNVSAIYTYTLPTDAPVSLGISGNGVYTLSVTTVDGLVAQASPATLPLTMTLQAPVAAVAGFWQAGQALDLRLTLTNTGGAQLDLTLNAVSSDFAWQLAGTPATATWADAITLAAGESRTLSLPVTILPDASVALSPRFSVRATATNGAFTTATLDLPVICGVPPVNPNGGWTTAGLLRGGLNVAWRGLGSQPVNDQGNDHLFDLFDEIVSPAYGWTGQPDDRLTVDLAGDEAVPVAGVILNGFGRSATAEGLRHFEVLLSTDGQAFTVAYAGELAPVPLDQSFVFTQPVPARFAQVRLIDNWRGRDQIGLGEFKVIAASDYQPAVQFNLLDPARGGHVVWGEPLPADLQDLVSPTDEQPTVSPEAVGTPAAWVVGFHHNRTAQITALHWRNAPDGAPENRFSAVEVQVSTASPIGPWQPLTTWTLDPTSITTQTLALDTPAWARFVRYVAQPPTDPQWYEYPTALGIDEYPLTDSYRSILAEWGGNGPVAIYEEMQTIHALGSQLEEVEPNDDGSTAQPLAVGQPVNGTTWIGRDEDWFAFTVPANVNTLNAIVRGDPAVSVDVELLDSSGEPVSTTTEITGGQLLLNAPVTAGDYYLRVHDPKRSIVFSWDTSGSVGPYLTKIYQSMATFTQDIDPAYELVNLLPFGDPGQFLLEEFSGDALAVQRAFTNYPRQESSSSAESNLLAATEVLATRPGVRAVVLMTDAESSSYGETGKLWQALAAVQPRVFSFEISSGGLAYSQDLMQDWAAVGAGHYANMATLSAFEQGFARAACFLRRPAAYSLTFTLSQEAPPPTPTPLPTATATATPIPTATPTPVATPTPIAPGSLTVVGRVAETGQPAAVIGGGAVELILDASGSMLQLLEGKPRIQIARETLTNLTTNVLPAGTQLALRVFGHLEAGSCRTDLVAPLQSLDPAAMNAIIAGINAKNLAKTPIAASLRLVAADLAGATGQKVVVLVTDGEETCDGDPAAEIANLRAQGIDVRVNIVGFAVDDAALQATFEQWATLGGGSYFNANNAGELDAAVNQALAAPFRLLDATGAEVASGVVNGEAVALPAGTYTVDVLTEPVQQSTVTIAGGEAVTVTVE
jgi:hypothetical protein